MNSHDAHYMRQCREKQRLFCQDLEGLAMEILADGNVKASNQLIDLMMECRLIDPERFWYYKLP
jgi:hypothetical protein